MYTGSTKNILTKEVIRKELLFREKKLLCAHIVITVAYTAFISFVLLIIYSFGLKDQDAGLIPWVLFLGLSVFFPAALVIYFMATLRVLQKIERGDFLVTTDIVVYKEEKTVIRGVRKRRHLTCQKTIHFQRFGDIHVDSTSYDMASPNDVFYMVIPSETAKTPLKYYPQKLYEYKK